MQKKIIGWDIGGAHLKAAILEPNSIFSDIRQVPCQLWKGLDHLELAVEQILSNTSTSNTQHAITMTGELVDLFESREQGVQQIIQAMQKILAGQDILIYAGTYGFLSPQHIQSQHFISIASANWLASASLAATQLGDGLFIDIGSTTTDLLHLSHHHVNATGLTDYDRMRSNELVYTGIIRTSVMAVAQTAYFQGQQMGLMAEYFATMADVYRLTKELNEGDDQTETADGAEKSIQASAKRLSRMTGYEYQESELSLWQKLAQEIKSQQKNKIKKACQYHISQSNLSDQHYFIGAGVGRFLAQQIAKELGHKYIDFSALIPRSTTDKSNANALSDCAPAVSVAWLVSHITLN